MAKRFLDTGFLSQKWIRKLTPEQKCFLIYIMLECDNAGIIDLDFEDAEFWIGKKIDQSLSFLPKSYVIFIRDLDKYFIPKFIEYQYGDLSSNKNIVAQARRILSKYGLLDENNKIILDNLMIELPKSQVTSNSNSNSKGNSKGNSINIGFVDFWNLYNKKVGSKTTCENKWIKLKDSEREKIINTLPNWLKQFSDKQFQPFPETYLNQERWNDELPEIKATGFRDTLGELEELHNKGNHGNN